MRFTSFKNVRRDQRVLAWLAVVLALLALTQTALYAGLRERVFDVLLAPAPAASPAVVVVDIDRAALLTEAPWPWDRARMARLVTAIAGAQPAAIAIDVLFEGPDRRSPAALAEMLAAATGRPIPRDGLVDGDRALADALSLAPTAVGFVLDDDRGAGGRVTGAPVLVSAAAGLDGIWTAAGAVTPPSTLADAARGVGALSLIADPDGRVRRVPLVVSAGGVLAPGLALDAVRLAGGASALLVQDGPLRVTVGAQAVALAADGMLRLVPVHDGNRGQRVLSAANVLADRVPRERIAGRIVLIGSSAPEAGGLRIAAGGALVPTVELLADAVDQIVRGQAPVRPAWAGGVEVAWLAIAVAAGLALATLFQPLVGAMTAAAGAALLGAPMLAAVAAGDLLVDPLLAPAGLLSTFAGAAIVRGVADWRRVVGLRQRLEQQLPAEIVRRLIDDPRLGRLAPETREITVLATDIEGFTRMVERCPAASVVAMLDTYLALVTEIVERHGGVVDKFVGDAVLALFNAPLDVPDHPQRALDCALEIAARTDAFRAEPRHATLGLGRTRIGLETGPALVGDVGGRRLDYTAYGDAVNMASRLEAANKELGSTIAVGEAAAAAIAAQQLRPIGRILPRGRSTEMVVWGPWPADYHAEDRQLYLSACGASREMAADLYRTLRTRHPDDGVLVAALARGG